VKIGDTFLRTDSDRHLWIVLSDPKQDPDKVLLVNMTTWNSTKEDACMLNRGDHPWIKHKTCINYNDLDTIVTTAADLDKGRSAGAIVLQRPLSKRILARVLEGAAKSERLSLEKAEILEQQGLIDI
jgi:hypothetical protein